MVLTLLVVVLGVLLAISASLLVWLWMERRSARRTAGTTRQQAEDIQAQAQREAESLRKEAALAAREEALRRRQELDDEVRRRLGSVEERERQLTVREQELSRREGEARMLETRLAEQQRELGGRESQLLSLRQEAEELIASQRRRLEEISALSAEEARRLLVQSLEEEARQECAATVKRMAEEARERAEDEGRKIVTAAIQRCAVDQTIESTVTVLNLPSDEMKGRIIGREGRNIRALELATGVDIVVDDTPEAVVLSGFDPFRRAVAREAICRLMQDGRIQPARIEEVVEKVKAELEAQTLREGEAVALELEVRNVHPELLRLLGRLKYRTSYGQNLLDHSREVAYLAGLMAREVQARQAVATRAGLLHDIGKALDRSLQGTHVEIGLELLRKHGEAEEVIRAVAAHHFETEFASLEAQLVQAADAISASRPGARRDVLETYVRRLAKLEQIAQSFEGVTKSYALQAGREVRIIVDAEKVSDEKAVWLSRDIARKVEAELQYPGQIKVVVIREMRAVDYAR
jgi:ribonuclease Y